MAWKYPHLYRIKNKKSNEIVKCIESSLFSNYFLHFAGSWYESDFWKNKKILNTKSSVNHFKLLSKYLETKTFGLPIKNKTVEMKFKNICIIGLGNIDIFIF